MAKQYEIMSMKIGKIMSMLLCSPEKLH